MTEQEIIDYANNAGISLDQARKEVSDYISDMDERLALMNQLNSAGELDNDALSLLLTNKLFDEHEFKKAKEQFDGQCQETYENERFERD